MDQYSGVRILELAERAYSLYVNNNHFKKRRLLDMVSSKYVLKDGKVHMDFKEVFAKLIDGIEEEEKLTKQKAQKSDIDNNWLPKRNPFPKLLSVSKFVFGPK